MDHPRVLLVEDSPADLRLTKEAFRDANPSVILHLVADGEDAMAFLRREGAHVDAVRPALILLDLNLPRMSGRDVLALVKSDDSLKSIPTVILSTLDAHSDIVKGYGLQENCYLRKPEDFDALESMLRGVIDFWLTTAKLPSGAAA
jgi:chemotaxis family two-component system response regulator Rcp1